MKTVTVQDLRNRFKQITKWIEAGETVQIIKRGEPFARILPEGSSRSWLGCAEGLAIIPPDFDDPMEVVKAKE